MNIENGLKGSSLESTNMYSRKATTMDTENTKNAVESGDKVETQTPVASPQQSGSAWRPQDADREVIKAGIRRRVWSSNASPKAQFIPAKPLPSVQDDGQKTVAVYARVSTKSTEQVSSIENQTRYYTEKVENLTGICMRSTVTRAFLASP